MFEASSYRFPHPEEADEQGLVAVGGDLSTGCLLTAYYAGIFPWYDESQPLLWWSPDPRMVLFPEKLHISKSMRPLFNQRRFKVTYNRDFSKVIQSCAEVYRAGQGGTWITAEMIDAYIKLHQLGYAQSVEVWEKDKIVGGLYGIYLKDKRIFCGESMFAKVSNASKYGFITLVKKLRKEGVRLIDCQVYTQHLQRLGAEEIPRSEFLRYL